MTTSRLKKSPSRFESLLALIKHIGPEDKCLIFTRFKPDLLLLKEHFGELAACYFGGIPQEEREIGKKRFQDPDDPIKYFIGQQRTAGIGHTLTQATHVIFYCNDGSLRFRKESEKRAHRKGQEYHVTVWDILASKTQDSKIIETFQSKDILSRVIMQDPDEFFLVEGE